METYPLAGTIKRGKNNKEDKRLARQLLNDPKEIAEHNMLVDLHGAAGAGLYYSGAGLA